MLKVSSLAQLVKQAKNSSLSLKCLLLSQSGLRSVGGFSRSRDSDFGNRSNFNNNSNSNTRSTPHSSSKFFFEEDSDKSFEELVSAMARGPVFDVGKLEPIIRNIYKPPATQLTQQEVSARRQELEVVVTGPPAPAPISTFEDMGFPDQVLSVFKRQGYTTPTHIQCQGWPVAMSGHDMVGIAQTGSGKTVAFALPAMMHIRAQPNTRPKGGPYVLILSPTRELANQIKEECLKFSPALGLSVEAVYGGAGTKGSQSRALRNGIDVLIACPGRLLDLIGTGAVTLQNITYLVLDEADVMLEMGFEPQLRAILAQIRPDRQTLMWSATWPAEVSKLARDYMVDPVTLMVGKNSGQLAVNKMIEQKFAFSRGGDKMDMLKRMLQEQGKDAKVLVFTNTKHEADSIARDLYDLGLDAQAIHGDKSQTQRESTLSQFRRGHTKIMVATDVAARGLDVKDIDWVVNYDMPKNIEIYVHRIGRTGRAGKSGIAITFIERAELSNLANDIRKFLHKAEQEVPAFIETAASSSYGGQFQGGKPRYGSGNTQSRGGSSRFGGPSSTHIPRDSISRHSDRYNRFEQTSRPERLERSEKPDRSTSVFGRRPMASTAIDSKLRSILDEL